MIRPFTLIVSLLSASFVFAFDGPPYVLQWPDSTGDILVAESSSYTLHRYYRQDDGSTGVESLTMSIGQNGAGKRREGDLRTPYGVYFITDRLDTASLHPKYGSAAYPMDYPSARDRQLGRTGSGIWLHGVLPGTVTPIPRDTDGCIAINNQQLNSLAPRIDVLTTPIIITNTIDRSLGGTYSDLRDELSERLSGWTDSLAEGRLDALLAFYSPNFSYQGLGLDDFAVLQFDEMASANIVGVSHNDVFIAADPTESGVFVTRFMLHVELSDGGRREQRKRLYWQRDEAGVFRIIAEDEA